MTDQFAKTQNTGYRPKFQSCVTNIIYENYQDAPLEERRYLVPFSQKIQDDFGGAAGYANLLVWGSLFSDEDENDE